MARPIQYDMDTILLQLMHLYWEKGYEETSIKDITDLTGLKPGSLYKIFNNKEGIFEAAMNQYILLNTKAVTKIFKDEESPIENINIFLKEFIFTTITNNKTNGCLLVKTLLVTSHSDKKIQSFIVKSFTQIENLLEETINKAKQKGLTSVDTKEFSAFIITTIYGAHVYYKSNHDTNALEKTMEIIMQLLTNK